jgi:hypothetical protein
MHGVINFALRRVVTGQRNVCTLAVVLVGVSSDTAASGGRLKGRQNEYLNKRYLISSFKQILKLIRQMKGNSIKSFSVC